MISSSVYTFAVVIKALCLIHEVDNVSSLLRDITKHGCVSNSMVYRTLIHVGSKCNRVSIESIGRNIYDGLHAWCRDFQWYYPLSLRVQEATKLIDRMLLCGFNSNLVTYEVQIHGLSRTRLVNKNVPNPNIACSISWHI